MSGADEGAVAATSSVLLNQPVVIDNGSSSIKAGFAGSSKPKIVLATKVGRTKHIRIMPGGALESEESGGGGSSSSAGDAASSGAHYSNATIFVGPKLDEHRGAFLVEYPMDKGMVNDNGWDAMERLWEHVYSSKESASYSGKSSSITGSAGSSSISTSSLNAKQEEHPVLITEAPLNARRNRDQMAEIFFESIRAPALYFSPPSPLSLYASGRTTGVVLDVGDTVTHAVPVYEGFALQHSVMRSNVAGRDVTRQLQLLLRRRVGLCLTTTAEADLAKLMKEQVCYLTTTTATTNADEQQMEKDSKTLYQLPDGQAVTLSCERYQAPDVLFDPSLFGSEEPGAADILVNSILRSDMDLRSKLFSQIVIAGGSTLTPGFGDKLLHEVRARSPHHTKIRISAPPERMHSCYVGGSILASLSTFKNMLVSREEYQEHGSNIVHRREL